MQTRSKLMKSLKGILNCCKLEIVFKSEIKLAKAFRFKDCIPKKLTSGVDYKFQCGLCYESYYGECVRHLNVRIGEDIGISPLSRNLLKFPLKLNLRVVLLAIICYFATILHPLKILVF